MPIVGSWRSARQQRGSATTGVQRCLRWRRCRTRRREIGPMFPRRSCSSTAPGVICASGSFSGHEDDIRSAAFSPDGKRIVTASWDRTARIWDAATGKPIGEPLRGHEDVVMSAAFSPDGQRIVTASKDRTARVWDAATGQADRRAAQRP